MFLLDVTCGTLTNFAVDPMLPRLTSTLVTIIQVAVPILLIFFGMLDLGKAVMAQKEDEIKKGQQLFIKRLIVAVIVFLVVFFVKTVIGLVTPEDSKDSVTGCIDCFINNKCVEVGQTSTNDAE